MLLVAVQLQMHPVVSEKTAASQHFIETVSPCELHLSPRLLRVISPCSLIST